MFASIFRSATSGLTLLLMISSAGLGAPVRVLFIGNSFTYGHANPISSYNRDAIIDLNGLNYGGVPGIFKQLTIQAGLDYEVGIEAVGGQTLAFHVLNKPGVLQQQSWDTYVMQGFSIEPLPKSRGGNPANFYVGAAELKKLLLAKNPKAAIYFYATWSSPTGVALQKYGSGVEALRQMADDLERASYKVAYDQNLDGVVRVGAAFQHALDQHVARPDPAGADEAGIDLWYAGDHRHPSIYGSYLSAVMFYAKLTKKDPRELTTGQGTAAAALKIKPDVAAALHRIAYEMTELPEPTRESVTTRQPVVAAAIDRQGVPTSLTTAGGTFGDLSLATAESSRGDYRLKNALNQDTRFFVIGLPSERADADAMTNVSLIDQSGALVGKFELKLKPADFTPADKALAADPASKWVAASFSLSDLGVANLADVSHAVGLRIDADALERKTVGSFSAAPAGADSIYVIGSGPPVVPVVKKKPATKPKAK